MGFHTLTSLIMLGEVKQFIASFYEGLITFLEGAYQTISSFLSQQNKILVGAVLALIAICFVIGLLHFIARRPKLFILLVIILALFVGGSYLASM